MDERKENLMRKTYECRLISFWNKSIYHSLIAKGKDQLLPDDYCYHQGRLTWCCIKDNCKGCARHNETTYEMYHSHACWASSPGEIEKAVYNYAITRKAENSHNKPRLIIQEARVKLSSDAVAIIPQYTLSQRSIQCIRKDKNISKQPIIFVDIMIPLELWISVSNQ